MTIYTVWRQRDDDGESFTLIEGEGPPRFSDGRLVEPDAELVCRIEAKSWDEANQRHYDLQGWGPYRPLPD